MAHALTLTPAAAKRIQWIAEKQSKPAILRLSVEGGGCSGFQYKFDLAQGQDDEDSVSETDGVKLVVDPISLDLVGGSAIEHHGGASHGQALGEAQTDPLRGSSHQRSLSR